MARAYSLDLRRRVVAAYDEGEMSVAQLATRFRVKRWWIYDLLRLRRESGSIMPRQGKTGPKPKLAEYWEPLRKAVQETPDATLEELRENLGLVVSISTLWRALNDMKLTFKKKSCMAPNNSDRMYKPNERGGV